MVDFKVFHGKSRRKMDQGYPHFWKPLLNGRNQWIDFRGNLWTVFFSTKSTFPFKTTGTKCWFKICVDGFPIDFYWQPKAIIPWRMLAVKIYALGDCTCLNLEINFSHSFSSSQLVTARDTLHGLRSVNFIWLVVSTPLTNIKVSWEYCSICIWTTYTIHLPNHQPVIVIPSYSHWNHH